MNINYESSFLLVKYLKMSYDEIKMLDINEANLLLNSIKNEIK